MVLNAAKFQLLCHNVHEYAPSVLMNLTFANTEYVRCYSLILSKILIQIIALGRNVVEKAL